MKKKIININGKTDGENRNFLNKLLSISSKVDKKFWREVLHLDSFEKITGEKIN